MQSFPLTNKKRFQAHLSDDGTYDSFAFLLVGAEDAGTFKGADDGERYATLARRLGFATEAHTAVVSDVLTEIETLTEAQLKTHPTAVVFAGQLAFLNERCGRGSCTTTSSSRFNATSAARTCRS